MRAPRAGADSAPRAVKGSAALTPTILPKRGEPRVLEIDVADGVQTVRLVVG